jgi:polysaccharide lyase-like protein
LKGISWFFRWARKNQWSWSMPGKVHRALAILLVLAWGAAASAASLADGFESGTIGPLWRTHRVKPGGATVQQDIVRSGAYALRFNLHQGDMAGLGGDGEATERAEIQEADGLWARSGETYEHGFSMYLPLDFPIVDTRLVIGQWKQTCQDCSKNRSPIIAQRFRSGVFFVTIETTRGRQTIYQHRQSILGQWLDLRYRIRFAWSDGSVTMWLNGGRVAEYRGPLGYPDDPPEVYFKFGLYRDRLRQPMTIYFDDYRKDRISQE